jgi:hypothetical protein
MAINLEQIPGATAPLLERLDRQDAQARQDRWMLELERAALASSAKKLRGGKPRDEAAAAPQAPLQPADAEPASATAAARATGGSGSAGAQTGADAARPGSYAQAGAMPLPALRMAASPAGGADAMAAAVPTGMPAVAAVPATAAPSSVTAAAAGAIDTSARRHAGASLSAFGWTAAPAPDHAAQAGVDMAGRAASGAAPMADGAQFDKRLMHLFAGPDGTHAYIRDAELGAAQARSVAAALGAALADSGQALAALTVNGKRISLLNKHAPGAVPASVPFNLQPLALVRKEYSK